MAYKPLSALNAARHPLLHSIQGFVRLLLGLSFLGMLLPVFKIPLAASNNIAAWLLDLAAHWQWMLLPGFLILTAILACWNKRWLLCLLLAPLPWLSASPLLHDCENCQVLLTVASANVEVQNQNPQLLIDWLADQSPDLVIVLEVSPQYALALNSLKNYPYRIIEPDTGWFGMALLSRFPLLESSRVRESGNTLHIQALVKLGQQAAALIAFHPMPPATLYYHQTRNDQLKNFIARIEAKNLPGIIAGDFNATPWSTAFALIEQAGWRRTTGLKPTWPALLRGFIGIPIDHVVTSPEWRLINSTVGPDIGSDHFPVLTRLTLSAR